MSFELCERYVRDELSRAVASIEDRDVAMTIAPAGERLRPHLVAASC
jgi:hypothetical protein